MENTTARELGRSIREARRRAGLTQADLGDFVGGVDRHMIASLERGEFTTQMRRLLSVLDAVGLEIALTPRSVRLARDPGVPGDVP